MVEMSTISLYHLTILAKCALLFLSVGRPSSEPLEILPSKNIAPSVTKSLYMNLVTFNDNTVRFCGTADSCEILQLHSKLDYIAVYSTPLEAPFASSTSTIRKMIQRQFFPVDYHAFVVFRTANGKWHAVDKMRDGVYMSYGESKDSVLFYFNQEARPRPVKLMINDTSSSEEYDLYRVLSRKMKYNPGYDIIENNCQRFAKELFDKFASLKWWNYTPITELTSPVHHLITNGYKFFRYVAVLCDLYFSMFSKTSATPSGKFFHCSVYCFMILLSVIFPLWCYVPSLKRDHEKSSDFIWIPHLSLYKHIYIDTFVILTQLLVIVWFIIECVIIQKPLGTMRMRAAQYREMWKSGNFFLKLLLPLSYGIVHVHLTVQLFIDSLCFLKNHVLPVSINYGFKEFFEWCIVSFRGTDIRVIFLTEYVLTFINFAT